MHSPQIKDAAIDAMRILNAGATCQQFNALCDAIAKAAQTEAQEIAVAELRIRLDGWLRKIIFGTGILIITMVLGAWIAHLTR